MIQTIRLYHGTNSHSFSQIIADKGFDINKCRSNVDFGAGVYTTTNKAQADEWATKSAQRIGRRLKSKVGPKTIVFDFVLDRLAECSSIFFIRPTSEFWDLVKFCRDEKLSNKGYGSMPHHYDVVGGVVASTDFKNVKPDFDQLSFHSPHALNLLYDAII